jgi:murein DD-endopeptidase MepM/ murein hydrolase activator NlpD
VAARFQNAPFLDDLLNVINHPTSEEQPDLLHFRLELRKDAASRDARHQNDAGVGEAEVALFLGIWFLAVCTALALGLRRRLRFKQLRAAATISLLPVLVVIGAGLRTTTVPPGRAVPAQPVAVAKVAKAFGPGLKTTTTVAELDPLRRVMHPDAPAWNRLVLVESQVASEKDQLAAKEKQIQHLALSTTSAGRTATPTPSATPADTQGALALLLTSRDALAKAYHKALQDEYELYRQAAQDQALRDQLWAGAVTLPASNIADALRYNLQVLQTQLTQESAINAAVAKLSSVGSLSAAQLAAMRHHQPFIIPVAAGLSQGFGPSDLAFEPPITYNGIFYPHFHTGLDVLGPPDAPVHASADGVVALATATQDGIGRLVGYGNYVVIAHPDGFFTLYGHLQSVAVKEGQVVHQGQIIGIEGSTGLSTGPHVHFEIRRGGQFLDPAPYLAGQIPA